MFRDLKEYQDIAKIYAEKVSKPENLEERRGSSTQQLAQNRKDAFKPVTPPQKGAGGGVGNPTNTRGTGGSTIKPIVRGAQGRTKRPEIKKPLPSTAEIRAKNPKVVPGTRVNEIGAKGGGKPSSGDLSMFKDKKPATPTPTPQAKPKMGSPDSKFIKKDKGVGFVKRGTPNAQRAENLEKNKNRAKEMAKARLSAKNKPVAGGSAPKATPAAGMPTRKVTSSTTQSGNTTSTRTKVTSGTGGGTAGLTSSAGSLEANKKKAERMKKIAAQNAAMEAEFESKEFDAYDLVLEYLLSSEQVATIEEANYVMTEMDAETIQGIVEEQKKTLTEKPGDGYIGPKFLNIKNPITNFINKKRNQKGGGNYRVDEVEKNAGVESGFAGEKIKF